jgi:hypothetical protein
MHSISFIALIIGVIAGTSSLVDAQSTSGWILWEKNFTMKGSTPTTQWEPQDGFDTLAECRMSAQQLFQFALAYMKDAGGKILGGVRPDGRSAMFAVTEAGVQQTVDIRYVCFPGTFDPRPQRP